MAAPKILGIAGGTAGGKTEFAQLVERCAPSGTAAVINLDSYYKAHDNIPLQQRALLNYDHPDSLDFDLLIEHLTQLREGSSAKVPVYNFATHNREDSFVLIEPRALIIVEGILVFADKRLKQLFDLKVYVHTPDLLRLKRRIQRDVASRGRTKESVIEQWQATVHPMHERFCYPSRHEAQITLSGEQDNTQNALMILRELCGVAPIEAASASATH